MWLFSLTSWFSNAFTIIGGLFRTISHWILNRLYLLIVPLIATMKLIYDFIREIINELLVQLQTFGSTMSATLDIPELVSFVNAYFPLDTLLSVLSVLFTLWIGCLLISAIIKIKQAILF